MLERPLSLADFVLGFYGSWWLGLALNIGPDISLSALGGRTNTIVTKIEQCIFITNILQKENIFIAKVPL